MEQDPKMFFTTQRALKLAALCAAIGVSGCGGAELSSTAGDDDELGESIDPLMDEVSLAQEPDLTPEEQALAALPQQSAVNGLIPESNPPVDPAAAAKEAAAQDFARADGLTSLDAEEAEFDANPRIDLAARVKSDRAPVRGVKQATNVWCAPASARTMLFAFDSTPPSQRRLANRMETTSNGTLPSHIPGPLNHFQDKIHYILSSAVDNTSDLITRVKIDVGQNAGVMAGVQGGELPTWAKHGFTGGHAIVLYGWSRKGTEPYKVMTWDPLRVSWSGAHAFRAKRVVRAMKALSSDTILIW